MTEHHVQPSREALSDVRAQGERAGRAGFGPEANPCDPDSAFAAAWEDGRQQGAESLHVKRRKSA